MFLFDRCFRIHHESYNLTWPTIRRYSNHSFSTSLESARHAAIAPRRVSIAAIFEGFHVSRLEVFGSAARVGDFNPVTSDVDFLIEFADDSAPSLQDFFGAKTALENLLGRTVDLVEPGAVRNPYLVANINRHRETVYAE